MLRVCRTASGTAGLLEIGRMGGSQRPQPFAQQRHVRRRHRQLLRGPAAPARDFCRATRRQAGANGVGTGDRRPGSATPTTPPRVTIAPCGPMASAARFSPATSSAPRSRSWSNCPRTRSWPACGNCGWSCLTTSSSTNTNRSSRTSSTSSRRRSVGDDIRSRPRPRPNDQVGKIGRVGASTADRTFATWARRVSVIEDVPSAPSRMTGPKISPVDRLIETGG